MKGLTQFIRFDWESFAKDKSFVATSVNDYIDYETKEHLGTRVECVIAVDKTPYDLKDGKEFTNRYEKIAFKVRKDINVPLEARVMPKGNVIAKVYGEFKNQLSVTCDDIVVATASAPVGTQNRKEN